MLPDDRLLYFEILLPLPLENPVYGYLSDERGEVGRLCEVPFGHGKGTVQVGVIVKVSEEVPIDRGRKVRYKRIHRILPFPPIAPEVLKTWKWAAEYSLCSPGEVLNAALPSGVEKFSGKGIVTSLWRIRPEVLEDKSYGEEVIAGLGRKKGALAFMERLINGEIEAGLSAPSLSEMASLLGVTDHTLSALRKAGVIEAAEVSEDDFDPAVLRKEGDSYTVYEEWGDKNILLSYHPFSKVEERVPVDFIRRALATIGGQYLLLFPNLETLKLLEPLLRETFGPALFPYYHTSAGTRIRERSFTAATGGRPGLFYGLRQAVWLPFRELRSVVIVDEEDRGYRQFEPAPRFTASYLAMMLARAFGAKVWLTSAAPSVETMLKGVMSGRYAYRERKGEGLHLSRKLSLVDMEQVFLRNEVSARMLSPTLARAVSGYLESGKRVLLIYQRQGFAKYISCGECLEILKCPVCGTALRYFGGGKRNLVCPACGHIEPRPEACPHCGAPKLRAVGTGVERLSEALRSLFGLTEVPIIEGDTDEEPAPGLFLSTDYEPSIRLLRSADLVGVVQWDLMEFRPDFRATERSYRFMIRLLSETKRETPVIAQFFRPYGAGIKAVLSEQYKTLLDSELENRNMVGFSPFSRQIDIVIQSDKATDAFETANHFIGEASDSPFGLRTLGPSPLNPSRQKAEIGYRVTLLVPLDAPLREVRSFLHSLRSSTLKAHRGSHLFIYFDVDPQ